MFSCTAPTETSVASSLLIQINVFWVTHIQLYSAQLSHFILYNITMCSFLYTDMVECGSFWKSLSPLKTSHRWLCSSLVCKNETEFCAKKQEVDQATRHNPPLQISRKKKWSCFIPESLQAAVFTGHPGVKQGGPTPRSAALTAVDDWSSAAAVAVDGPLGGDGRWTMGAGLSLGSVYPHRCCQETWRTEIWESFTTHRSFCSPEQRGENIELHELLSVKN